ncbi:MAG: hypothetical protein J5I93_12050, partial [Pirellulaceae bacterium]|nr:hypothetical protein [Pirellulaceae bacterium]
PGPLELSATPTNDSRSEQDGQESVVDQRRFADDPWFARLPPSLRDAIRSRSRRAPPRGYEERLRRYFESID